MCSDLYPYEILVTVVQQTNDSGVLKVPRNNPNTILTLILRHSRTGTVWFYTSTSKQESSTTKTVHKVITRDLKLMYSRLTLVRISINL